jgi:hypothetical protein
MRLIYEKLELDSSKIKLQKLRQEERHKRHKGHGGDSTKTGKMVNKYHSPSLAAERGGRRGSI